MSLRTYFRSYFRASRIWLPLFAFTLLTPAAFAGGPRYVAGVSYFNPAVLGQPVLWQGGKVSYFVDQGPLGTVSNAQATAMVDAAAALWSRVPTAAVSLTDAGSLAEDVNGGDVVSSSGLAGSALSFSAPGDVTPASTTTPIAVIFDADGSVINALEGQEASAPTDCELNGVLYWIDNMTANANLAHGVIVLNGLCATSSNKLAMMSYQIQRAFGQLLGLDFSQVNDNALNMGTNATNAAYAWPVMQPISRECGANGGTCIPNPGALRPDDIAALNRLYPVTSANLSAFSGKVLTAANTVSIQGNVVFPDGQGMQGVNVVARPLDANGNPLYQYTVSFVSGAYFAGNHGNPVTGWTDNYGNRLDRFGSNEASLEGFFDLSGIVLPPGMTSANYQVSFEAVNAEYVDSTSVGPYLLGSPAPYGGLATVQVNGLVAGGAQTLSVDGTNRTIVGKTPLRPVSPAAGKSDLVKAGFEARSGVQAVAGLQPEFGTESRPEPLPAGGMWTSRIATLGQSDWFTFPVRGNRIFTIVTQALDPATGVPSAAKAMPAIGIWDSFDPIETAPSGFASAQNGTAPGETWLQVASAGNDTVRLGVVDQRGDGRPDYLYQGWVLYADTVAPERLPSTGGMITIRGRGFHAGDSVLVGGVAAQVVEILPTEIVAIVSAAAKGVTGSQDVTVNDLASYSAIATIPGGVSYDSAAGDALSLITAPMNQVPLNVPQPFTVLAEDANGHAAGGVTVTYSVTMGAVTLGCGQATCSVTTTGDGRATLYVSANSGVTAGVTAALTNGASIQAQFYGITPPALTAITSTLYLAAGATIAWPVQAIAQSANAPAAGLNVTFQSASGIAAPTVAVTTNAAGIASATLTVGPLAEGQSAATTACITGTSNCATFNAFGSRPEFASLAAVSGTSQSVPVSAAPAPVVLRVLDMDGNPMAGATVTVSQALYAWTPPCPPHGRCSQAQLLASKSTTLTSALDGSVTLTPLTQTGAATNLVGVAASGNNATLKFAIESHP